LQALGAILTILGFFFSVGGIAAYAGDYTEYVAVLIVFGGIFLIIGIGLVANNILVENDLKLARRKQKKPALSCLYGTLLKTAQKNIKKILSWRYHVE